MSVKLDEHEKKIEEERAAKGTIDDDSQEDVVDLGSDAAFAEELTYEDAPDTKDAADSIPFTGKCIQNICIASTAPQQTADWIIENFDGRTVREAKGFTPIIVQPALGAMFTLEIIKAGPFGNVEPQHNYFGLNFTKKEEFDKACKWLVSRRDTTEEHSVSDAAGNIFTLYRIPGEAGVCVRFWVKPFAVLPIFVPPA
jgi:hypothetical protein